MNNYGETMIGMDKPSAQGCTVEGEDTLQALTTCLREKRIVVSDIRKFDRLASDARTCLKELEKQIGHLSKKYEAETSLNFVEPILPKPL